MFLAVLWVVIVLLTFYLSSNKPKNFPPGPSWLPVFGCLLHFKQLSKKLGAQYLVLQELSKRYKSDVVGLKLGEQIVISVSSYKTLKEVMVREEFNARSNNYFSKLRQLNNAQGITCAEGALWAEQRAFIVRHFRQLGFGKDGTEIKIKRELKEVVECIDSNHERVDMGLLFALAVLNILETLVLGTSFNKNDPHLYEFLNLLEKRNRMFDMAGGLMSQFPWLRFIAPEKIGYNIIKDVNHEFKQYLTEFIDEHDRTWTEGNHSDIIYAYLTKMKEFEDQTTNFTRDQLLMITFDLFLGGSHTVSTMLKVIFLMMIIHPEVQKKSQQVLDEAFDKNYEINYSDIHKVPYVNAIILEVERYCYIFPVSGPRRAIEDTILDGYFIPKDSTILLNIYSVMRSKEIWGDPDVFRPDRFLNEQGALTCPSEFMPFNIGKRRCLGEGLARSLIFIFVSEILRKYTVEPVHDKPLPSAQASTGILSMPQQYFCRFLKRNV